MGSQILEQNKIGSHCDQPDLRFQYPPVEGNPGLGVICVWLFRVLLQGLHSVPDQSEPIFHQHRPQKQEKTNQIPHPEKFRPTVFLQPSGRVVQVP